MVKDSDKVDGLHANDIILAAGGGGGSSVSTNPMIFAYKGDVTCDAGMRKVYFRDG